MKRFVLLLGLVLAMSLVFAGAAYANFGPHGGYIEDTDSCAGCHRAHTSFSSIRFTPAGPGGSSLPEDEKPFALLVGSASTMTEFCNACHGENAPGASTNVVQGIFDAGPSTASMAATSAVQPYQTESTFNGPLNGGGFSEMPDPDDPAGALRTISSAHTMEATNVLWGAGSAVSQSMNLNCSGCHDPHGSSNYRLLRDRVNEVTVGGYATDGTPNGIVFSNETNYPSPENGGTGWLKHQPGQDQMVAYKPDYTGGTDIRAGEAEVASLSTWCSACHTRYNKSSDTAGDPSDYDAFEGGGAVGAQVRHRHPVDIALGGSDDGAIDGHAILEVNPQADNNFDSRIPLETRPGAAVRSGQLGCLTCHYAHGSVADMSGWSNAHLVQNAAGTWVPSMDTTPGVEPDKADSDGGLTGTSALLRADNRGVCERCHDK